jgi:hypothetical protein
MRGHNPLLTEGIVVCFSDHLDHGLRVEEPGEAWWLVAADDVEGGVERREQLTALVAGPWHGRPDRQAGEVFGHVDGLVVEQLCAKSADVVPALSALVALVTSHHGPLPVEPLGR